MARVLLVEDEAAIMLLLSDALLEAGHEVRDALSAAEAREVLAELGGAFDVLVTDVNVGARGWGFGFALEARQANPAVKVIYISGDSEGEFSTRGVAGSVVLPKPFMPHELVTAVQRIGVAS